MERNEIHSDSNIYITAIYNGKWELVEVIRGLRDEEGHGIE